MRTLSIGLLCSPTRSGTVPSYCSKQKAKHDEKWLDLHSGVVDASRATSGNLLGGSLTSCSSSVCIVLIWLLLLGLGNGLCILLVLVDGPVKDVIVLESFTNKEITEDLAKVGVVWLVVKAERSGVVEVDGKLIGEATAENLGRSGHLLLHDTIVLLLLGGSL